MIELARDLVPTLLVSEFDSDRSEDCVLDIRGENAWRLESAFSLCGREGEGEARDTRAGDSGSSS